jgi:repressor LexA
MYSIQMMKILTDKQQLVLEFVQRWQRDHGFPPSVRDVAGHFQFSVNAAAQHLRSLEQKQYLLRTPGKGRALTVIQKDSHSNFSDPLAMVPPHTPVYGMFPLLGSIPAGTPLTTYENPDDFLELSPEWFGKGELVAVKVTGESMAGDYIGDGDIAIIKKQNHCNPNEIVAVRVDGYEVTLKRLKRREHMTELVPSNASYETRLVPAEQVEIIGKLVTILRKY